MWAGLIDDYLAGPELLARAVRLLQPHEWDARPVAGRWSTREVVCHIADFEPVYVDRIKRVLAEDFPPLRGGDPDLFAARLCYANRDLERELAMIAAVRAHLEPILRSLSAADFRREGLHSADGPLTLETLLRRVTGHIPHHIRFINEKVAALHSSR